jgi:hypothetical protein
MGNESLHEISNDTWVRVVNFTTSKNVVAESTMFPHRNSHKIHLDLSWGKDAQPDGSRFDKTEDGIQEVRSFRGADCDTDHYLVVAKVRERLAVSKRTARTTDTARFNVKKLNEGEVTTRRNFAALET